MYQRQKADPWSTESSERSHCHHSQTTPDESLCFENFTFTLEESETDERVIDVSKPFSNLQFRASIIDTFQGQLIRYRAQTSGRALLIRF